MSNNRNEQQKKSEPGDAKSADAKQETKTEGAVLFVGRDDNGELQRLRAENEQLKRERQRAVNLAAEAVGDVLGKDASKDDEPTFRNDRGQLVPLRYHGTKTYFVGNEGHYREGKTYVAGDTITVTDEKPSITWTEVRAAQRPMVDVYATTESAPAPGRSSDAFI